MGVLIILVILSQCCTIMSLSKCYVSSTHISHDLFSNFSTFQVSTPESPMLLIGSKEMYAKKVHLLQAIYVMAHILPPPVCPQLTLQLPVSPPLEVLFLLTHVCLLRRSRSNWPPEILFTCLRYKCLVTIMMQLKACLPPNHPPCREMMVNSVLVTLWMELVPPSRILILVPTSGGKWNSILQNQFLLTLSPL